MNPKRIAAPSPLHSSANSATRTAAIIQSMSTPPGIQSLSYLALKTIAATRLLAVSSKLGRDPLLELSQRFSCITTAKAFLGFADCAGGYWPQAVQVLRPCCRVISPDEWTFAQMVDAAAKADRDGFARVLEGFVRSDRHETLYEHTLKMAALMS